MSAGIERKLTTILAADVEGYSRLMAADEVAAMAMLKDCREVFARLIERHRGRIANTAGDGLIADFPSVVEAVQCAVEVQRELTARNRERPDGSAMRFRIGVHLGDVMVDRGDLFGEGVNMAARLQSMAEPGGVLISQAVYDQVRAKLSIGYEYLGERRPKNLGEKVPVYRLILNGPPPPGGGSFAGSPERADAGQRQSAPKDVAAMRRLEHASSTSNEGLRRRVLGHATQLGVIWLALATINLFTGSYFWAVWPGIAFVTVLGLEAAPLVARGWIDAQAVRLTVVVAGLAMINAASRSGEPWFLWPGGALIVLYVLMRARRPSS